jgi:hypothetical protein
MTGNPCYQLLQWLTLTVGMQENSSVDGLVSHQLAPLWWETLVSHLSSEG